MKSKYFTFVFAAIGFTFELATLVSGQTTNVIPPNLFITDDGHVFWFKSGKRVIDIRAINTAQGSLESLPTERDPDGHWGGATNGFQLSLRFPKLTFTNGEPIVATLLLRNVTNSPVKFLRAVVTYQPSPINVLAYKNGKPCATKGAGHKMEVISGGEITVYPQTQRRFKVKLNDYYDFTGGGEFVFQADLDWEGEITSQKVPVEIK